VSRADGCPGSRAPLLEGPCFAGAALLAVFFVAGDAFLVAFFAAGAPVAAPDPCA